MTQHEDSRAPGAEPAPAIPGPSVPAAGVGNDEPREADVASVEVREEQLEVSIQRSVRFGRLIIVGTGVGAIIAVMVTLMFPVVPEALYEMRQIAGFMVVLGAAIGLLCGALLGLILNIFAKRRRGTGVAVHTDVQ